MNNNRELYEYLLENTYDGFWDWDLVNNTEYMSPKFWKMFGFKPEEKKHLPEEWHSLIFEEDLKTALDLFDQHVKSKGEIPYNLKARYRHKDGSTVYVICRGNVIEWDEEGKPLRMLGVHTDITELENQNKLMLELQAEKIKAEEKLSNNTKLVNYIFHEIRNPINVIGIGLNTIEERNNIDTDTYESVEIMKKAVERASKILNDTLDFNKFENGTNVMNKSIADVTQILENSIHINKIRSREYNINIYTDLDKNLNSLIDKDRMFQVFNNLLSNAIKFTPENGNIFVSLRKKGSLICFEIKDTGCGISSENLPKIFTPYNNVKADYSNSNVKGMGLGLSIIKNIVEMHNSSIKVESELKKGTVFRFDLEYSHEKTKPTAPVNSPSSDIFKDVSILIVDDDKSNKVILKKLLRSKGAIVESLEDGIELVEFVKKSNKQYDLILLDNLMKEMNGKEALGIIRKDYKGPIAMLTGSTTQVAKDGFMKAGANWVLEKPLDLGVLELIIQGLVIQELP